MSKEILTAGVLIGLYAQGPTAFNDQGKLFTPLPQELPSNVQHGAVFAANDANFDAAHLSEPMNEFILGAPDDEGLLEALELIAPSIPCGRSFTYRAHDTKEQYQTDSADDGDIREIGGDFGKVRMTGTQADGRTDNKGLTMVLDNDQGGEEAAVQQRAVTNLRNRLLRSDIRRTLVSLDAVDTDVAYNLGPANAAADIDGQIITDLDTGGDARGVDGNVVIFGKSAGIKRTVSYRRQDTAGARSSLAATSSAELAALLNVDTVVTLPFRYQSTSSAKAKIAGDVVFSYHAKKGAMPNDPSNIKRFVTMTPSGMFRVYIQAALKRTLVTVEHYSRIITTSSLGVRKNTITFT